MLALFTAALLKVTNPGRLTSPSFARRRHLLR